MNLGRQTTLRNPAIMSGIGVHSNAAVSIVLHPAEADTGIRFCRTGLPGRKPRTIAAHWSRVIMTELCTVIGDGAQASVATIEHLLAAFRGLGIDNALVEIDGPEVPIMDGSAAQFVDLIDEAGIEMLSAPCRYIKVVRPVRVVNGRSFCELRPAEDADETGLHLDVEIDFDCAAIGRQKKSIDLVPGLFRRELARARTFGFLADVERLCKAGFALGASLENTIALQGERVLNPEGLRYADEFVRHKVLDAIGDLALAGGRIIGQFRSHCGGHRMNVAVLKALFSDPSAFQQVDLVPARIPAVNPAHVENWLSV
ncbi:MAG: UDP-3-O-acyl-N-acetylglucosamine deacetylase [Beijerinckiaceae bacterium]|nr:MAG: UDP-3-O-acyl-N-acetylglucosamine deacetylase [Beijerinckiaceae bacterium]